MRAGAPVFELVAVERHRPRAPVVGPFSLQAEAGSLCVLEGPSGAGKSTLLALLAGVETADRGRVLWQGIDMTHAAQSALSLARRGRIGIVGQGFALLEHLPLWQSVAVACVPLGVARAEQRRRALAALERMGVDAPLALRLPRELSGGERQRAALACALISANVGLIADEPTSNQDAANAARVVQVLRELRAQGCALVVSSHDPELLRSADQRLVLPPREGAQP